MMQGRQHEQQNQRTLGCGGSCPLRFGGWGRDVVCANPRLLCAVMPDDPRAQITLTVGDALQPLAISGFDGIDSNSSPSAIAPVLRWRLARRRSWRRRSTTRQLRLWWRPRGFGADAEALGAAIEGGATAYLGQRDFIYGVDVVVALDAQGRG